MTRRWLWLELVIGWLPVWALFTVLIATAHGVRLASGALIALRTVIIAAVLGLLVKRIPGWVPWPHPFRLSFVVIQLGAAFAYAAAWLLLNSAYLSIRHGALLVDGGPGLGPTLIMGVWIYVMVAGVAYTAQATERAARAETLAATSRLAALRGQLHPHFLFNALHTVVQLIPKRPRDAAAAAEELAALLRTALEDDRDLVLLAEETAFVERYLGLELIRFGDRLTVRHETAADTRDVLVPSFAVQTLVENAVRHGAAPRVEPTEITIAARLADGDLEVAVRDTGGGADAGVIARAKGTGLARLRERLDVLYGPRARLDIVTAPGAGFTATLRIPRQQGAPGHAAR